MRHGKYWAGLAVLALFGCTQSKPLRDMVGYVPPTSLPAPAKRTLVREELDATWTHLIDVLERSSFDIEQMDRAQNLLVARYSGDPEPYVDCGSIVTHQAGILGQITGSTKSTSLNYKLEDEPVVLDRTLNLDSRIIVTLADQFPDTVIKTETTYVVTKTIDVIDAAGGVTSGTRETISFVAGGRGEFSKGTACQPNGFLDLAVLESIPNIVETDDIEQADLSQGVTKGSPKSEPTSANELATAVPESEAAPETLTTNDDKEETVASIDIDQPDAAALPPTDRVEPEETQSVDWILPDTGLPSAALPEPPTVPEVRNSDVNLQPGGNAEKVGQDAQPSPRPDDITNSASPPPADLSSDDDEAEQTALTSTGETNVEDAAELNDETPLTIVDETTSKLLETLDCGGVEWHFCELVELTAPYRKRNITNLFGLTVNTNGSFAEQIIGSDLKLDVLFPSFPSYLHVAYARRDGSIDHVLSSADAWPADQAHRFDGDDQTIPGPEGLAMIIAIAADEPLFPSLSLSTESAEDYLLQLKERLSELDVDGPEGKIAASQLLIYVDNAGS